MRQLKHLIAIAACYFYIIPVGLALMMLGLKKANVDSSAILSLAASMRFSLFLFLVGWLVWTVCTISKRPAKIARESPVVGAEPLAPTVEHSKQEKRDDASDEPR